MGPRFREDDHLISSLLDLANLRFAPSKSGAKDGIVEMVDLQKEFKIFSEAHSLAASFAVLGLGGFWNAGLKTKLYGYLDKDLAKCGSETDQAGNRRIVSVLMQNLELSQPSPVYFTIHESKNDPRVLVKKDKPLTYMSEDYLIISLPMTPWR